MCVDTCPCSTERWHVGCSTSLPSVLQRASPEMSPSSAQTCQGSFSPHSTQDQVPRACPFGGPIVFCCFICHTCPLYILMCLQSLHSFKAVPKASGSENLFGASIPKEGKHSSYSSCTSFLHPSYLYIAKHSLISWELFKNVSEMQKLRGAWVAQSVKCLSSAPVMTSGSWD